MSVAVGDIVLLYQSQGTGVGNWELVKVATTGSGSFTCDPPLVNTYVSGAQAVLVPQYSGGTVSGTITASDWAGSTGGIIALCCSGKMIVSGSLNADSNGYRGGGLLISNSYGFQGEGTSGTGIESNNANTVGGGGGQDAVGDYAAGGGGGGHYTTGTNGQNSISVGITKYGGTGGNSGGNSTLTTMIFGGGAGSGGDQNTQPGWVYGGTAGDGGGIILIFANSLTVTGSIAANGGNGGNGQNGLSGGASGGGGGGAGGSIMVKSVMADLGTSKLSATGGNGGVGPGDGGDGGAGSAGRFRIESCNLVDPWSTNPNSPSFVRGGHNWCSSANIIIG